MLPYQRYVLLTNAKSIWINSQVAIYGYNQGHANEQRMSVVLNLLTIGMATITFVCSLGISSEHSKLATQVLGGMTTATALINHFGSPPERMQRYANAQAKMEKVQRDLATIAARLESTDSIQAGDDLFRPVENSYDTIISGLASPVYKDAEERAEKSFAKSSIANLMLNVELQIGGAIPKRRLHTSGNVVIAVAPAFTFGTDDDLDLPDDAPGVVAFDSAPNR